MKIAVNTRLLIKNKLEGIGWFSCETLKRITRAHPEHQFYFLFDRPFDESFVFGSNVTPIVIRPQARHPILFYLWFEKSIPRALKKINPDLFMSTDGYLSLSTTTPSLPVIHDLNFEHYPEQLPFLVRKYYKHYFPRFARKAARFSKSDIVATYGIQPDKIDVVYNGANEIYQPINSEAIEVCRNRHAGGSPYFLFVGSLLPRKNIANLFSAFDLFKRNASNDIKLMIIGERKWWTSEIKGAYEAMEHRESVIFKGHTSPDELQQLIPSALALTYVSFFEGFGIPIIEAMRCGTPVITSDASSMPEIAGGAAMLTDPSSIQSIADAMTKIATSQELQRNFSEKGLERAKDFSWDATADKMWESMLKSIA
ncbi:MAG TPA: glycosyltransferase family 1 protein [Flavobacteriales bacterium]|nr:glycosyltransferase family 1 protein [Flavobacteriales bacterium]